MKNNSKQYSSRNKIGVITLFLLFLLFSPNILARDYGFPSLLVNAVIEKDGSIFVKEKRTVIFDGEFKGLYQWIDKQPGEEISDISIKEGSKEYEYNSTGEIGPSGTYFIKEEENRTYIDWSFEAENETKIFTLSYRINNAVKIHNDVAELYYIFTGDEWEKPIGNFKGELFFPSDGQGAIRAWGHGPLNGQVTIEGQEKVIWEVSNIPARTLVAGKVTFPLTMVPDGTRMTNKSALDEILAEEEKLANKANLERKIPLFSIIIGVLAFLGGIFLTIYQWIKHGKEPKGNFDGEYYRELPSKRPPVEAGYLYRFKKPAAVDITATILDFGRRGFLTIEEYQEEKKSFFRVKKTTGYRLIKKNKNEANLTEHEKILMDFIFKKVANSSEVTFEEISEFAKKNKKEFLEFWNKWNKIVSESIEEQELFEKSEVSKVLKRTIPGIAFFVLPVIFFIFFGSTAIYAAAGLFPAGFIYLISLSTHQKRTEKGTTEYNKWKAFKKFIKDFSKIDKEEIPSIIVWEHYLVYAVSLGVAKEAIKALEIAYPDLQEDNYRFGQGWYVYNSSLYSGNAFSSSLNHMTTSINQSLATTVTTATGQQSSGSGSGGGFSGGGGGGASGGGGGGAR